MILDATFLIDLIAEDVGAVAKLDEMSDRLCVVPTLAYTDVGVGLDEEEPETRRFGTGAWWLRRPGIVHDGSG